MLIPIVLWIGCFGWIRHPVVWSGFYSWFQILCSRVWCYFHLLGCVCFTSTESLILAQDERWRR
ncbi:hypothetical protein, partial [Arthrobacter sp. 135MFCol5.1]|uniref:hypothetical protein n=1 Tax=Arthrobacter sp. 135MFCol5.1 TaxID=1158050 RepID=UPI001E2FEDB4